MRQDVMMDKHWNCSFGILSKCDFKFLIFCNKTERWNKMKLSRRIFFCTFFLLGMFVDRNRGSVRVPRQVIQENGLVVKEWWLGALYRILPSIFSTENSVPTPLMFLPYLQTISSRIFQVQLKNKKQNPRIIQTSAISKSASCQYPRL